MAVNKSTQNLEMMKKLYLLLVLVIICFTVNAQTDTTVIISNDTTQLSKNDTIRVGNILIIKKGGKKIVETVKKKPSRITTNWIGVDLGLSNYNDQTNYSNTGNYIYNRAGAAPLGESDFKLRTGKSINVNIWLFMQKLDLIKHNVSLVYGLGVELNNYRYRSAISYKESGFGLNQPFVFRDSVSFIKNKLAADYATVPLMLSFASNKVDEGKGVRLSFGVSGGYLYSERNKQKSSDRGKKRNKGDYDLNRFKLSYVGELGIGPIKLYASYSPKTFYDRGLNMKPYNFGIRLSHW